MENDEANALKEDFDSQCAVNSLILDYYKKFGRKRDLEQFFSLSTAQGEIKDTGGLFWSKMKSENDSSDSGGQNSESFAQELCRISIRCSVPEGSSSQSDDPKTKMESPHTESPPIITDDPPADTSRQTDDESLKSDDNHSQKSFDPLLDLSAHKPLSPTSSVTSQRKLEWDSLADVGYANESERKASASSLSTLERLALKQQYSNNDTNQDIGHPTCHSTPVDENEVKAKIKRSAARKVTKIIKKNVDLVEVNVPHTSDNNPCQSINVNLTKHISFNVEKDGVISVDNTQKDINISPEKNTEEPSHPPTDKEIQTSLPKPKNKSSCSVEDHDDLSLQNTTSANNTRRVALSSQRPPVIISLNTLRKKLRMKKSRVVKKRRKTNKQMDVNRDVPAQEKSGEQLSEAESFEYMPGHIYNQHQMIANESIEQRPEHNNTAGNKSSLESSCGLTTDSSKGSKHSLTQDLEKCINVLKVTLQKRFDDSETKKKLIKDIVQKLLSSKYRDDDTSTEFLSGLSFNSKKLDMKQINTLTSTSDANNTDDSKEKRPKKSILRMDRFDSNIVASTSQSAPNLVTATKSEKAIKKPNKVLTSYSESDESSKGKSSSENALAKTSSEKLYLMYLEALRREEFYKRHLKDKEMFLKQKLGSLESQAFRTSYNQEVKVNNRLKDLMKDLTRNNYDDGSGDASKLEGGSTSDRNYTSNGARSQRSHSVFTLSSNQSENQKKPNLRKKMQVDREFDAGSSKHHYCCCPHHVIDSKVAYVDSSVQVNIKCQYENENNAKHMLDPPAKFPYCEICGYSTKDECRCKEKPKQSPRDACTVCSKCGKVLRYSMPDNDSQMTNQKCPRSPQNCTKDVQNKIYDKGCFCVCSDDQMLLSNMGDHKCLQNSKLSNRPIRLGDPSNIPKTGSHSESSRKSSEEEDIQFLRAPKSNATTDSLKSDNTSKGRKCSQSSQTNMLIKMMLNENSSSFKPLNLLTTVSRDLGSNVKQTPLIIHEATRCLQTEISINPQISDPTLSDLVIVSDCVEFIGEQYREVSKRDLINSQERKTFSDVYTSSESGKYLLKPGVGFLGLDVKASDLNLSGNIELSQKPPNDYAIPIEGTNMTLLVSLASKEINEKKERINQAVGTEKSPIADQATCIATECAKSAQCQQSAAANTVRSTGFSSDHRSRQSPSSGKSLIKSNLSKPSTRGSPQRSTYPKEYQPKDKRPLLRSNTDSILETCSGGVQTEPLNKLDFGELIKQLDLQADTTAHSCQASKSYQRKVLRTIHNKDEHPNRKEIAIQKDLFKNELFESHPPPEMISRSVGSDIEILPNINEVCYQVGVKKNIIDNISKKLNTKCGSDNKSNSQCEGNDVPCGTICKDLRKCDSNFSKCLACGRDLPYCDCRKVQKTDNIAETEFKICGCDVVVGDKCAKHQENVPSNSECVICSSVHCQCKEKPINREIVCREEQKREFKICGCDLVVGDKCAKHQENFPSEPKCVICGSVNCQCKEKKKVREIASKNSSCEKCGFANVCQCDSDSNSMNDPIIDLIKDITRRYSKNEVMKIKKKKRFTEIITVLNYLLETDDSTDLEPRCVSTPGTSDNCDKRSVRCKSSTSDDKTDKNYPQTSKSTLDNNANVGFHPSPRSPKKADICKRRLISRSPPCCNSSKKLQGRSESESCACKHSKSGELTSKCASKDCTESSDLPCSTDLPSTSDSTACKILRKIKRECEKYHMRRNKCGRKCEISSSTSINCEQCKKVHHCGCRHKCKRSKAADKLPKKCVAYNLILQTSESMLSEGTICDKGRPLKNVVVKVPKCKDKFRTEMCKETLYRTEKGHRVHCSPRGQRSKSCPKESEFSSTDDFIRRTHQCTIREYLEKNRPDFVAKCVERQSCLKYINEMRANERTAHRELLSLQVHREPDLTTLSTEQLRELAQQIGLDLRRKKLAPKFINEHEMKKHSKDIYKTLPEVVQKKEDKRKENIKKTNLLMANIFKKNLQKNTLRGAVNISNYSSVIKI